MANDLFAGLPDELQDMLDSTEKESSIIEIKVERRKYGKFWAVVTGFDASTDIKTLLKTIKAKMACGGTVKERNIEILLGRTDKSKDLANILVSQGFNADSIHISKG